MATNDSWHPTNSNQGTPLRVVLLGTTGAGKSATGNTLLGSKIFKSSSRRTSVTGECSVAEVDRFGKRLVVVDTPGVLDTGMSDDDLKVMLKECTHLACPGVHVFLFLMKIGDRDIGGKDKKTFDIITKMFGEKFLDYTIVVFTAKECLGNRTFDQFVSGLSVTCTDFINSCKGGCLAVSNVLGTYERQQAAEHILDKVKDLVQKNDGRCYKNKLFDDENEEIRKRMERLLEQNENTKNKIDKAKMERDGLISSFKDHAPTNDQSKRLEKWETTISKLEQTLITDRYQVRKLANDQLKSEKKRKK
ncbi:GTPase IMAP family member 9-like [Argopecten irradians]|uniref:GTPase IMAP family member 9-like n=1 Tax=Argopecten irradians TaxID=31199 RepID=UPI003719E2B2